MNLIRLSKNELWFLFIQLQQKNKKDLLAAVESELHNRYKGEN